MPLFWLMQESNVSVTVLLKESSSGIIPDGLFAIGGDPRNVACGGTGAIGIEVREDSELAATLCDRLNHTETSLAFALNASFCEPKAVALVRWRPMPLLMTVGYTYVLWLWSMEKWRRQIFRVRLRVRMSWVIY